MEEILTEDDIDELKEVFLLNSKVDHRTQQHRALIASIPTMLHALGIGMEELEQIDVEEALQKIGIDTNEGGADMNCDDSTTTTITVSEFIQIAKPYLLRRNPVQEAAKLFKLFDEKDQGYISSQSLRRVAEDVGVGHCYTDEDFNEMIQDASQGRKVLRKVDFVRMLLTEDDDCSSSSSSDNDTSSVEKS